MTAALATLPVPVDAPLHDVPRVDTRGLTAAEIGPRPELIWVAVRDLRIDRAYQRAIGERGVSAVRKMVEGWDWDLCGVLTVAELQGGLWEVIDGQHRAAAAASHGGIASLPALVVRDRDRQARARVFVELNSARTAVTPCQRFRAAVAAGDPDAVAVDHACKVAGIKVLHTTPASGWGPGETMSVGAMLALRRQGGDALARALRLCASARLAPVKASHLGALGELFNEDGWRTLPDARIVAALRDWEAVEDAADLARLDNGLPARRARAVELARRAA